MVNKYIGARYVPKIMGEWNNTTTYEALSIVTYQGGSYTSKCNVPAGIIPTNQEYWVITGNYDAQVELYRQEVRTLDTKVETFDSNIKKNTADVSKLVSASWLLDKKIVVYGDSLSESTNNYWKEIKEMLGDRVSITNRAIGGTELTTGETGHNNGYELIVNANDLNNFDFIFLCYGVNDWAKSHGYIGNSSDFFEFALKKTIENIFNKAPKINLVVVTPYFVERTFYDTPLTNKHGYKLYQYNDKTKQICGNLSVPVIDFYSLSSCNQYNYRSKLEQDSSGYAHQTKEFAKELANIILGYSFENNYRDNHIKKNMLSMLEFPHESYKEFANWSSIPRRFLGGLMGEITANTTKRSTSRHTILQGETYVIKGYVSEASTLKVFGNEQNLISVQLFPGIFEIEATPNSSAAGYLEITNNSSVTLTFSGLTMYCKNTDNLTTTNFVAQYNTILGRSNVTQVITNSFGYKLEEDTVKFSYGEIKALSEITKGTTLLQLPNFFISTDAFINIVYNDKLLLCKVKEGGIVYNDATSIPVNGVFYIVPTVIPYNPYNMTK